MIKITKPERTSNPETLNFATYVAQEIVRVKQDRKLTNTQRIEEAMKLAIDTGMNQLEVYAMML